MKAFATIIDMEVKPQAVWSILIDGARWAAWNPTVEKVDGIIAAGNKIKVYVKLSPGRAFPVRVSEFLPPHRMVWSGGMPLGLFKGVRTYTLEPSVSDTEFTMREEFRGFTAPLITRSIPDMQPAFNEFAAALKRHAESITGEHIPLEGAEHDKA